MLELDLYETEKCYFEAIGNADTFGRNHRKNYQMKKLLPLFIVLLSTSFCFSQNPTIREFYSGNNISFLLADSNFIWELASPYLIKREINTNQVQLYSFQNSNLPNTYFRSMIKDKQNRYWIATDIGLVKFENGVFTTLDSSNSSIPSILINNISIDSSGIIWLTASNMKGILIEFDGNNLFTQHSFANLIVNSATVQIKTDKLNRVWLLQSDSGFVKFDGVTFSKIMIPYLLIIGSHSTFDIDASFNIYLAGYNEIFKYNGIAWSSIYQLPTINQHVLQSFYDGQQAIWFNVIEYTPGATFSLYKYEINTGIATQYSSGLIAINGYYLSSMAFDVNNSVWSGYYGSLQKLTGNTWYTYYNEMATLGSNGNIVPEWNGSLCVSDYGGTTGSIGDGSLNFYDGHSWRTLTQFNSSLLNDKIVAIAKDKSNNLWMLANNHNGATSFYKYDGQFFTNFSVPTSLNYSEWSDMVIDTIGNVWISSFDRIYRFNNGIWSEFPIAGIPGIGTNCDFSGIAMDLNYNIWMAITSVQGHFIGVARFDGTTWTYFAETTSSLGGAIISCNAQNKIVVTVPDKVYVFDGATWTIFPFVSLVNSWLYGAVSDNYGKLYAVDTHGRLLTWNGNSWMVFTSSTLIQSPKLLCDKNNNIYFIGGNLIVYNDSSSGVQFNWDKPRVSGTVYYDGNQNKIQDGNDNGMGGQKLYVYPDSTGYLSDMNGEYSIPLDSGYHSISNLALQNWALTTDSLSYHFRIDSTSICCYDFGTYPTLFYDSLEAHITCVSRMRCGFDVGYVVNYRNLGTNSTQGRIVVTKSDSLQYLNAFPQPNIVSNDSLIWNFSNLNPGQERIIYFTCKAPLTSGLDIPVYAVIQSFSSGTFVNESTDSSHASVTCSFDPNDKEAIPHGWYEPHYTLKKDKLEYIIRFQNLGNDTAFTVVVRDTLSAYLDFSSLEIVGYSHPVSASVSTSGLAVFRFNTIRLPHDEANEPGSHGFIRYKIAPKVGLPDGTKITNSAQIYFDFNPAIFTNSVFNTLVDSLSFIGIDEPKQIGKVLTVFPNPSKEKLSFINEDGRYTNFQILDISGRVLFVGKLGNGLQEINVTLLEPSMYFLRLSGAQNSNAVKISKQ